MNRLEMLEKMVVDRPEEPFVRYGLAMEYKKVARNEEAKACFETLMREHPTYLPAYLMAGNLLESMGDPAGARSTYERGSEVARAASDEHTLGELQAAIAGMA